jgi:cell division transport system permease protein
VSYSLREALAACRRAPLLVVLSVIAIALSLFVVGLFGLAAHNIRLAIDHVEERVEVVGYLQDGVTREQLQLAQSQLRALPEVHDVAFTSKEAALAAAVRNLPEFREIYTDLEINPLPASLDVSLRAGHRSRATIERVAQVMGGMAFVEDVRYGGEWLDRIFSLRRVAAGGAGILGSAFALVGVVIITTAIRIAVFARREEISIMRLVGATPGFVRRPFLLEGFFAGILGGTLAVALTYLAFLGIDTSLMRIAWLPTLWVLSGVAAGAVLGFAASAVAVRRHLKAV